MIVKLLLADRVQFPTLTDLEFSGGSHRVGRSKRCDQIVNDPTISREHAEIELKGNAVTVRDLNSQNGTFMNDIRISKCQVANGAILRFGRVAYHVAVNPSMEFDEPDSDQKTLKYDGADESVRQQLAAITPAQMVVLDALLDGLSEKEAAVKLKKSPHTIHNHVREIYQALGVRSRAELLAKFVDRP